MEGRQKLFYLPEPHTDFIFAVITEELGVIGAVVVLLLLAIYAWRGIRVVWNSPDSFGRMAALGITAMVAGQGLVNLGVVLGMVPTKGIPLPFVSYGGSSLIVMLLGTGVLLNISQQASPAGGISSRPAKGSCSAAGAGRAGRVFRGGGVGRDGVKGGEEGEPAPSSTAGGF